MKEDELTFVFPTLRAEGDETKEVGGADLVVSNCLFFQFKMPEFLRTRAAIEIREGSLPDDFSPFYRMYIKNSPKSCQFNLLQKAARSIKNSLVQYISPMFHVDKNHEDEDAFYHYFRMIPMESMKCICSVDFAQFINPDRIQPEDDTHKICYSVDSVGSGVGYIFSEPEKVEVKRSMSGYDGQSIRLDDNPEVSYSVNELVSLISSIFDLPADDTVGRRGMSSIRSLQRMLIANHNIFWVPVLRDTAKRWKRVLGTLTD